MLYKLKTLLLGSLVIGFSSNLLATNRLLDSIIATVDDIPITLVEFGTRLNPPRNISIDEIKNDNNLLKALDALILEKLLLAEAERKGIRVSDDDISKYIEEVKIKNGFNQQQFEDALRNEGQNFQQYKDRIKTEILKSRVAAASIKNTTTVTEEEVNQYIKNKISGNSTLSSDRKIHIKKITLLVADYSESQALALAKELLEKKEDSQFILDLGMVSESELSPEILDVVQSVETGKLSNPINQNGYWNIFQVIDRETIEQSNEDGDKELEEINPEIKAKVRTQIEQEKLQRKMEDFIEKDLPNLHTIDKRI
jgi:parvulin-like peptidyl-prolyl isomerase